MDSVVRQLRAAFPEAGSHRYEILDRDAKFDDSVTTLSAGDPIDTETNHYASALAEWELPSLA